MVIGNKCTIPADLPSETKTNRNGDWIELTRPIPSNTRPNYSHETCRFITDEEGQIIARYYSVGYERIVWATMSMTFHSLTEWETSLDRSLYADSCDADCIRFVVDRFGPDLDFELKTILNRCKDAGRFPIRKAQTDTFWPVFDQSTFFIEKSDYGTLKVTARQTYLIHLIPVAIRGYTMMAFGRFP